MSALFRRPPHAAAAGDPIPFAHDGRIHLFYLSSPPGTVDYPERVRTSWQHAVSTDLEHWDQLAPALEPGPIGSYDGGGIWTGSVVEHDDEFFLFYTAHDVGAAHPQTICLATSGDLVHFARHPDNPLVLPAVGNEPVDWRDPFVFFNESEDVWWMLIAARLSEGEESTRGCIMLATSDDLVDWTMEDQPLYAPGTTFCPECPELWEDGDGRWHLVYSRFSERAGTVHRVAESPRGPFRSPRHDELGGRRWYAAKSAPFGRNRVFFGWIHDRMETGSGTRWLWGGDFALPRLATPTADGLSFRPAVDVSRHWTRGIASCELTLTRADGVETRTAIEALPPSAMIETTFTVTEPTRSVGLVLRSGDRSWRLAIDPVDGGVGLVEEPVPLDDFWADLTNRAGTSRGVDGPVVASSRVPPGRDPIRVTTIVDADLLEVYLEGATPLTHRLIVDEPVGLDLFVEEGSASITVEVSETASS